MPERKPRLFDLNDYDESIIEFCKNPRPLWEIVVVSVIMSLTGIILAAIMNQSKDFRAAIIVLWFVIPLGSVLYQGCIYPNNQILSWLDTACVSAMITMYTIVFAPIAPWWCWLVAAAAIVMFLVYQVRRYSDDPPTVMEYIWLVNSWHILTIATMVTMYLATVD